MYWHSKNSSSRTRLLTCLGSFTTITCTTELSMYTLKPALFLFHLFRSEQQKRSQTQWQPNEHFTATKFFISSFLTIFSTRPFLSDTSRLWLTYQLAKAVDGIHEIGITHGDIKCENAVLTSWDWLFLTDFAPYKPLFIPEANNGEFDFYFVSIGKRKCYIAPERFYATPQPPLGRLADKYKMDVFSVGYAVCIILG